MVGSVLPDLPCVLTVDVPVGHMMVFGSIAQTFSAPSSLCLSTSWRADKNSNQISLNSWFVPGALYSHCTGLYRADSQEMQIGGSIGPGGITGGGGSGTIYPQA